MSSIRIAEQSDISIIKEFIHQHWKNNHILVTSDDVFNRFYCVGNKVNFVIAEVDNKISAVLGFIETKNMDVTIASETLWLALWKVNDTLAEPATGIKLLRFLEQQKSPNMIGTLGISDVAGKIYKALGYTVNLLDHYFIGNSKITKTTISKKTLPFQVISKRIGTLTEASDINSLNIESNQKPEKSIDYVINKYQNNPFYQYKFLHYQNKNSKLLLVVREVSVEDATVLRIVDLFGDINQLASSAGLLQSYVEAHNYEFVDCLIGGTLKLNLVNNGFNLLTDCKDDVCVPQYYEPFLQENKSIGYAFKTVGHEDFVLFKGDADQERPNTVTWRHL